MYITLLGDDHDRLAGRRNLLHELVAEGTEHGHGSAGSDQEARGILATHAKDLKNRQ